MVDWQRILWDLKKDYGHIRKISRNLNIHYSLLHSRYYGSVTADLPYCIGKQLLDLHAMYCVNKY